MRNLCSFEEFPALFTDIDSFWEFQIISDYSDFLRQMILHCLDTLFQICQSFVPHKRVPSGRPKHVNALRRKKARLKTRLDALLAMNGNPVHIRNVKDKLALICYDIKDAFHNEMDKKESKALEKIKTNPKYFYSYAKSLSKIKSSISMLFNKRDEIITDPKSMAE